jgi:hypothetical protein
MHGTTGRGPTGLILGTPNSTPPKSNLFPINGSLNCRGFKFGLRCMAQELHDLVWEGHMSHKASLRGLRSVNAEGLGIQGGWRFPAAYATDASFLRSWLAYDSTLASEGPRGKFNWNFLIGLLVAGGASAGFWAGMGMAIASLR